MLPLDLLRYFVAVGEELHFGRAARRLHMTQPPLSQRVRQLETHLGVELFQRHTRSEQLTPAGEVLLARARALLRAADEAQAAAVGAARGESGVLRLGFTSSSTYRALPRALALFTQRHPGVQLELHERVSLELREDLLLQRIDIALARADAQFEDVGLLVQAVEHEPMVVALPRGHSLARKQRLAPRDLERLPLVGFDKQRSPYFHDVLEAFFRASGARPAIVQESVLPAMLALVEAGLGAAVVPQSAQTLRAGTLVYRPLARAPTVSLYCISRAGDTNAVAANFRRCLGPAKA
jgi:DNA-binding transcriptional LysR family regulator